ncbi:peptide chain release factor N(5)-glutamine methyltransferase [Candidatus Marinimicrobia bacterium MT.SAG.4]|nr:peptide chain release factor N(5)-glutamine methyltransferase [Candidatus Marinimicrobia bacterium MT.SAG.4]TFB13756.1 peptide chain release factor N(5)-glutamine methyltransferase [Candidatus Marinimicrobia bacterium MT.SAG.4]
MANSAQALNIKDLLDRSTEYFDSKGIESPRLNAEWLLAHTLGKKRIELYLQFDRLLTKSETDAYRSLIRERVKNKPLQYIIGETDFMGIKIEVDENVLIPRPETEQLVELALERLKTHNGRAIKILDVGTGSGNIAIALAKFLPAVTITAIEISEKAIAVATRNAEQNEVADRINFIIHDIKSDEFTHTGFDMIISNPPYISLETMSSLSPDVREWEPETALTDFSDGLDMISEVIKLSMGRLNEYGIILLEIGGNRQSEPLKKMLSKAGYSNIKIESDYNSHARFASGVFETHKN